MKLLNKGSMKAVTKGVSEGVKKNAPSILSGVAVAGLVTTVILAVKATPKANEILEERKKELEELAKKKESDDISKEEIRKERIKVEVNTAAALTPIVGPAVISGFATGACIIGANYINLRRLADISAMYEITNDAYLRYKKKTKDVIGEKKSEEIDKKVMTDRARECYEENPEIIFSTGKGEILCFDCVSGRYFRSSKNAIESAANAINSAVFCDMFVSLNEFYYSLGIPQIKFGESHGWNACDGTMLELDGRYIEAPDGSPCYAIDYDIHPRYNF